MLHQAMGVSKSTYAAMMANLARRREMRTHVASMAVPRRNSAEKAIPKAGQSSASRVFCGRAARGMKTEKSLARATWRHLLRAHLIGREGV